MKTYDVTTIAGDGIGPEVCQSAVAVLREACGSGLRFDAQPGGAAHYLRSGAVLPDDTLAAGRQSHASLHGAAGLPEVTYPDGTEVGNDLHLQQRFKLDLFANVRPIRLYRSDLPGFGLTRGWLQGGQTTAHFRQALQGLFVQSTDVTLLPWPLGQRFRVPNHPCPGIRP